MVESVRAKFLIHNAFPHTDGREGGSVYLTAATSGDENKAWAKATPAGGLNMTIDNPAAFEFFQHVLENGKEVYIDITPAHTKVPEAA